MFEGRKRQWYQTRWQAPEQTQGNCNGKKSSFMVINGKTSSLLEELKDIPGLKNSSAGTIKDDEGVVRILENGTRTVMNKGVPDGGSKRWMLK